jgi:hypothetical protein
MSGALPTTRRLAIDMTRSGADPLELVEVCHFNNGAVSVIVRRFYRTSGPILPGAGYATLHTSVLPGAFNRCTLGATSFNQVFGQPAFTVDFFEASYCPVCETDVSCSCPFSAILAACERASVAAYEQEASDALAEGNLTGPYVPSRWEDFVDLIRNRTPSGFLRVCMRQQTTSSAPSVILEHESRVVNIFVDGPGDYQDMMRRRTVHGLGLTVLSSPYLDPTFLCQPSASLAHLAPYSPLLDPHLAASVYPVTYAPRIHSKASRSSDEVMSAVWLPGAGYARTDPASDIMVARNQYRSRSLGGPSQVATINPSDNRASSKESSSLQRHLMYPAARRRLENVVGSKRCDDGDDGDTGNDDSAWKPDVEELEDSSLSVQIPCTAQKLTCNPSGHNKRCRAEDAGAAQPACPPHHLLSIGKAGNTHSSSVSIGRDIETTDRGDGSDGEEEDDHQVPGLQRKDVVEMKETASSSRSSDRNGDERKFVCPLCPSRFKLRTDLTRHIARIHDKERNFECPVCGRRFGHTGHRNRHMRRSRCARQHQGDIPS